VGGQASRGNCPPPNAIASPQSPPPLNTGGNFTGGNFTASSFMGGSFMAGRFPPRFCRNTKLKDKDTDLFFYLCRI